MAIEYANADLPARRRAILAGVPGKLHFGIDNLVGLAFCAGVLWRPLQQPLAAFAAYAVARFAVGFFSQLPTPHRRHG